MANTIIRKTNQLANGNAFKAPKKWAVRPKSRLKKSVPIQNLSLPQNRLRVKVSEKNNSFKRDA